MRELILGSIRPVIEELRHVEIDHGRIGEFCRHHELRDVPLPDWREDFVYPWEGEGAADFFILFNTASGTFGLPSAKRSPVQLEVSSLIYSGEAVTPCDLAWKKTRKLPSTNTILKFFISIILIFP